MKERKWNVSCFDVGAFRNEKLCDIRVPSFDCKHERCLAVAICFVDVGTFADVFLDVSAVSGFDRIYQRCFISLDVVEARAVSNEILNEFEIFAFVCECEW